MISNHISVEEIERDLAKFLKRLESGEKLIITKAGNPLAEVKPVWTGASKARPFGLCAGDFTVPDDFDSPLPEQIVNDFEGK